MLDTLFYVSGILYIFGKAAKAAYEAYIEWMGGNNGKPGKN